METSVGTGLARCKDDFVIFHEKVKGDLAAAAAFKASPPALRFSVFHISSPAFQMSSSRQTCNGGQPQRRKKCLWAQTLRQMWFFFAF